MNEITFSADRQVGDQLSGDAPRRSGMHMDAPRWKKTVLIALYRPFSIRFVLQTDFYRTLKQRPDIRLVVATHHPASPELEARYGAPNVIIEELDMSALRQSQTKSKLRYMMRMIRLLTYNMRSGYALNTRRFMAYEFRSEHPWNSLRVTGKLYVASILMLPHLLGRSRLLRRAWVRLEDRLYGRNTQARLFSTYQPDLVLISSLGYGYDEQIIGEAKRRDVPVVAAIQSWDNTSSWGYPGGRPNHVVVWSEAMRREARDLLDVDPQSVFVGGVPHWDNYFDGAPPRQGRGSFLRALGLSPQRKTIYFATSSPKIYRHHVAVARLIADALANGQIQHDAQLLIRPHPGYYSRDKGHWNAIIDTELGELREIAAKSEGRVVVDDVRLQVHERSYDFDVNEQDRLKSLLIHSDVMVNFYSTQAIEAAVFDRPVVNVCYGTCRSVDLPARIIDGWDHYARVLATGGIARAYTEDALIDAINRYLEDPSLDRDGRRRIVEQEIPFNRGCAGRVIGEHILSLLDRRPT